MGGGTACCGAGADPHPHPRLIPLVLLPVLGEGEGRSGGGSSGPRRINPALLVAPRGAKGAWPHPRPLSMEWRGETFGSRLDLNPSVRRSLLLPGLGARGMHRGMRAD